MAAEWIDEQDALDVATVLKILGIYERDFVLDGRRPDERVPERQAVARHAIESTERQKTLVSTKAREPSSIKAVIKLLALGVGRSPEVDPCLHTRERLLTERLAVLVLMRQRVHKRPTRR